MSENKSKEVFKRLFSDLSRSQKKEEIHEMRKITNKEQRIQNTTNSLIEAIKEGKIDVVRTILESEFDPNHTDKLGNPPLSFAALYKQLEIAQLLLEYGADPKIKNKRGITPIDAAINSEDEQMTGLLKGNQNEF